MVSDDYFRTMGIPLLVGREFDRRIDRMGSPSVAIVSREAAKMLFAGEDPIGKRVRVAWGGATNPEIIGVAESVRHDGLTVDPQPTLYVCNMQAPSLFASLLVRTRGLGALWATWSRPANESAPKSSCLKRARIRDQQPPVHSLRLGGSKGR